MELDLFRQILDELKVLKQGQDNLENKFDNLENKFDNLENRFDNLENRFDKIENDITEIKGNIHKINRELSDNIILKQDIISHIISIEKKQKDYDRKFENIKAI